MPAPVALFAYRRPTHTQKTLEALANNDLAKQTDVYVFIDGPRSSAEAAAVEQTRRVIAAYGEKDAFGSFTVKAAEVNKGLANSVIAGVTEVLQRCGRAIVLEDDIVTRTSFLRFMNDCLTYYETDARVWQAAGCAFPFPALEGYDQDVFFVKRASSWGWGTWLDRWETIDWNVSDYAAFKQRPAARRAFAACGPDLPHMLDLQMQGKIDSWAVRWAYAEHLQQRLTVMPTVPQAYNIGQDASGTHPGDTVQQAAPTLEAVPYALTPPAVDGRLIRSFNRHYHVPLPIRAVNKGLRILRLPWRIPWR